MLGKTMLAAGLVFWPALGLAQNVVQDWGSVRPPAPPAVQRVTLDAAHTALLVLDFSGTQNPAHGPCNQATKPRCMATIPSEARLINDARLHGALVVYSVSPDGTPADISPTLTPVAGEAVVKSGPDKFVGTELADLLAAKGITTVIVTGTAAEGAVLDTALDAALREGLQVVVPVDLMSSVTLYGEQAVAWDLTHAPGISARAVLTQSDLIDF
jgi:nicotinamidase-related amidase